MRLRMSLLLPIGLLLLLVAAVQPPSAAAQQVRLPAPMPCHSSAGPCWTPAVKARWQYQLQGSPGRGGRCRNASTGFINVGVTGKSFATGRTVAPTVFDIDIFQDGKCYSPQDYSVLNYAAVQALHVRGAKVIGYIDAGTAETWRPDFPELQAFDQSCDGCLFGNPLGNYPDEYWLNINSNVVGTNPNTGRAESAQRFLLGEMLARLKEAKLIGVDAIEFDDVDAYQNHTGLSISPATQLRYNARLADLAHRVGFSVGLKNDLNQAAALQPYFDFAINEECWQYSECRALKPWPTKYHKAVFNVEYEAHPASFCPEANSPAWDFNSIRKTDDLFDRPYLACR
ncbi:MAG TPA: endo alpha-1,4 polygalactosaminidase [Jatrophihabitans sp.]|nr:endo alpha-1,4 polygalactosaminidase [Jatrophihabitans sp.]